MYSKQEQYDRKPEDLLTDSNMKKGYPIMTLGKRIGIGFGICVALAEF